MTVGGLVALFALARVYAFAVDGLPLDSPSASVAVATFAVETTSAAGCYFLLRRAATDAGTAAAAVAGGEA